MRWIAVVCVFAFMTACEAAPTGHDDDVGSGTDGGEDASGVDTGVIDDAEAPIDARAPADAVGPDTSGEPDGGADAIIAIDAPSADGGQVTDSGTDSSTDTPDDGGIGDTGDDWAGEPGDGHGDGDDGGIPSWDVPSDTSSDAGPETSPDTSDDVSDDPDIGPPPPFDGHTVAGFDSLDSFLDFAQPIGPAPHAGKFSVTAFGTDDAQVFYMSPDFYSLHDEFYWYRLLNGVSIDGWDVPPIEGASYPTIASIYDEFTGVAAADLPIGLAWAGGRLYAPVFYSNALSSDRFFGVGTLLYWPEDPDRVVPEELWTFELEFVDQLSEELLTAYFDHLEATLPAGVGSALRWQPRSYLQQEFAQALIAAGGPLADRIVFYSDLAGATGGQALASGFTAGKIKVIPSNMTAGGNLDRASIVVSEFLPEPLPPVAGLVLSSWTPPRADVVREAMSRGVPVAWMPGAHESPGVIDWAKFGQAVILEVPQLYGAGGQSVRWQAMGKSDFDLWELVLNSLPEELTLPGDPGAAPWTVDLVAESLDAVTTLLDVIGRRAVGAATLSEFAPPVSVAVTTRAFDAHHSNLQATLLQVFNHPYFKSNPRTRYVVLEGIDAFAEAHAWDPWALSWLASFEAAYDLSTTLGSIAGGGGLVGIVGAFNPPDEVVAAIESEIAPVLAALGPEVGLSLRPSGTADGARGIDGASLYAPEVIVPPGGDLGDALAELWASWWSYPAFQARDQAQLDPKSGGMAVIVQPVLAQEQTVAAGLATVEVGQYQTLVTLIAQVPAASATRPAPGETAEHVRVIIQHATGSTQIQRYQGSSYLDTDAWLLDDATLEAVVADAQAWGGNWLQTVNEPLDPLQSWESIQIDVAFALVAEGWPALASGDVLPARVVFNQASQVLRRLEANAEVQGMDIPRDLLPKIREVRATACTCEGFTVETVDVWTGPTWCPPTNGFGQNGCPEPEFNPWIRFNFTSDLPDQGISAGTTLELSHAEADIYHPFMHHGGYDIAGSPSISDQPIWAWDLLDGGWCSLQFPDSTLDAGEATCEHTMLYQSNQQWLNWLAKP